MNQPAKVMGEKPRILKETREPLQCWRHGGHHLRRNCPLENGYVRQTHKIQEAEIVGQVARVVSIMYAALEDHHVDH